VTAQLSRIWYFSLLSKPRNHQQRVFKRPTLLHRRSSFEFWPNSPDQEETLEVTVS